MSLFAGRRIEHSGTRDLMASGQAEVLSRSRRRTAVQPTSPEHLRCGDSGWHGVSRCQAIRPLMITPVVRENHLVALFWTVHQHAGRYG